MLTDIHLCKRASITHTDHIHSKVSEKIYDLQRFAAQAENKNEGSDDRTQKLLKNKHLQKQEINEMKIYFLEQEVSFFNDLVCLNLSYN